MPLSPVLDWLTLIRACSKDVVADETVVNDVYVREVNAYTLCKAKVGDVEGAMSPREKTPAKETPL